VVDEADGNRYRYDLKDLYKYRKETIERIFGLAKELHGFRYTQQFGKAQLEVKAALTYACLNLKKLAKKRWKTRPIPSLFQLILDICSIFLNIYAANPLSAEAESGFVYGLTGSAPLRSLFLPEYWSFTVYKLDFRNGFFYS